MAGFGPPPKPNRRRRNAPLGGHAIRVLQGTRAEPAPDWPYGRASKAELAEWERQWAKPMAAMWEYDTDVVARYVQLKLGTGPVKDLGLAVRMTEVRQLEDRLGLTVMARLRLRWQIEEESPADGQDESAESGVLDIRQRLAGS